MSQDETNKVPIPATLRYRPLPAPVEQATNGNVPSKIIIIDSPGNYPCRKCLMDGKVSERMLLFSYDPFLGDSPYRQPGPIFVHDEPKCEMAELGPGDFMPEQQRKRLMNVRAFDSRHMMIGHDIVDGENLLDRAEEFFGQEGNEYVDYVHVHNAKPGCFAVRIDRGEIAS